MAIVSYNGDRFDIEDGLTKEDVRESMKQISAAAGNATISSSIENGITIWTMIEGGGDKGSL